MPSTPRMIELERKASTPGEGLSRDERTEWHMIHRYGYDIRELCRPVDRSKNDPMRRALERTQAAFGSIDYPAANRYLDYLALKAR